VGLPGILLKEDHPKTIKAKKKIWFRLARLARLAKKWEILIFPRTAGNTGK